MPDIDSLAFDIHFALKHKAIGASARKFVRSLPESELEYLCHPYGSRQHQSNNGCGRAIYRRLEKIQFLEKTNKILDDFIKSLDQMWYITWCEAAPYFCLLGKRQFGETRMRLVHTLIAATTIATAGIVFAAGTAPAAESAGTRGGPPHPSTETKSAVAAAASEAPVQQPEPNASAADPDPDAFDRAGLEIWWAKYQQAHSENSEAARSAPVR
jgi:hypothetical protein